ncbi:MAG: hypothetical protein KBD06_02120 [Candidatus Pacebacteria bacterium]|nr:hypothetical protein [Candidatus Paceibacterota bacterium]
MSQHTGEYPLQAYMVVGGRYIEGTVNNASDTARFLMAGGPHLPADLQVRRCPPEVVPLRRQLMSRS